MSLGEWVDIIKWRLSQLLPQKWKTKWLILFFIGCWLIIFREPILRAVGNFLIQEDQLEQADAIFVLGGNIIDRSTHGVFLYQKGYADEIITLGENVEKAVLATEEGFPDAILSKKYMVEALNTPEEVVYPLVKGTSTKEEAEAILNYSKEKHYTKIIIVSDKFHLRRIQNTFKPLFAKEGIKVILSGAPNSSYKENYWWNYEMGMIMVNNEYVKLLYYALKY